MRYRRLIPAILLIALVVVLWPQPAHASIASSIASSVLQTALGFVRTALELVGELLKAAMTMMGKFLQSIISLQLTYGGPAVYAVWKIFRDMCNMLFIVLFIVIAFSTIFDSFLKNHQFSYKTALMGVIIAAIAINFSLAIGQVVVWGGNYASQMVISWMGPTNIGAQIATSLNVPAVIAGQVTPAPIVPPVGSIPTTELSDLQKSVVQGWFNATTKGGNTNAQTLALSTLRSCLQAGKSTVDVCFKNASQIFSNELLHQNDVAANAPKVYVASAKEVLNFWSNVLTTGTAKFTELDPNNGPTDIPTQINFIIADLFQDFMLLVLVLSFLAVTIFMLIRIPAIWILLSFSAIAFFSYALPNSSLFRKWFGELLGWCLFSPLYLFVIYIGLFFLSQQGNLTASFPITQMPFVAGTLAQILFFLIAGFIFIGGAAMARSVAFKFSSSAGTVFGKVEGFFGVSAKDMYGIGTVARQIGKQTGITPNVQALGERAKQQYGDITAGLRGRAPRIFGTEKEALAGARERFRVRGGAKEFAKLERTRIEDEKKILEDSQKTQLQKLQNARAQARTDEAREVLDGRIKKLKEAQTLELKRNLNSGNRDVQLAAGEMLMADGKMSPQELQRLGDQYRGISQEALAGFIDRRDTQLLKDAKERKYTKGNETAEIASYLALLADPKQAKKYFEEAKKGKNKIWALEAGTNRRLIMGPDGKTPVETLEEAVEPEAKNFTPQDWANLNALMEKQNKTMMSKIEDMHTKTEDESEQRSRDLRRLYSRTLNDPDAKGELMKAAKGNEVLLRKIQKDADALISHKGELDATIRNIQKKVDQQQANKAPTPAQLDDLQKNRVLLESLKSNLSDIKKSPPHFEKEREKKKEEKKEKEPEKPAESGGEKEKK